MECPSITPFKVYKPDITKLGNFISISDEFLHISKSNVDKSIFSSPVVTISFNVNSDIL